MITLDTSGVFALLDSRERHHAQARQVLLDGDGPFLVPAAILAEIGYLVERRLGPAALDGFLADVEEGSLSLDCGEHDVGRVRALLTRYADLPLGLADAAVAVCAERTGGRVLTFDRRDFDVLGRELGLQVLPPL